MSSRRRQRATCLTRMGASSNRRMAEEAETAYVSNGESSPPTKQLALGSMSILSLSAEAIATRDRGHSRRMLAMMLAVWA